MAERNSSENTEGTPSEGADINVAPEVLHKLLSLRGDGPLKHVENVILPEPLTPLSPNTRNGQTSSKRGPRSLDEWIKEIRVAWGNLNREEKLQGSWLASQPPVQQLAASTHGGGAIGRGIALRELLKKALLDAQKYDMDSITKTLLCKYPDVPMTKLAPTIGCSREQLSRHYCPKAARFLTLAFQRVLERAV